jgi:hypothetical protein
MLGTYFKKNPQLFFIWGKILKVGNPGVNKCLCSGPAIFSTIIELFEDYCLYADGGLISRMGIKFNVVMVKIIFNRKGILQCKVQYPKMHEAADIILFKF